jgi:excisionase family DNA binding protein
MNHTVLRGECAEVKAGTVHGKVDHSTRFQNGNCGEGKAVEIRQITRLLSPTQAAQYLGVSTKTLRRLFYRGHFGAIRSRHFVRYDRLDLDRWIDDQKVRIK